MGILEWLLWIGSGAALFVSLCSLILAVLYEHWLQWLLVSRFVKRKSLFWEWFSEYVARIPLKQARVEDIQWRAIKWWRISAVLAWVAAALSFLLARIG